ncbi:methyl-accepting chemotaxis protein [Nocardioides lianchengensis]|uniref:Methyl-accepting chemotaxis protein n=1 Tax=Nocardioides lianchengensis TaxID=1045774 RepID=A0A1G6LYJ7_9ACTN|nr:methyl-accepting chemotaxis protein [Nocardioides lianchengensis]NYG12404.1 methyl-accepting chemotaxis protein [Nocardioides lianchengensis]SDC48378.1 Methyl-accepting chemotaxis protein [Nocardioides lianchengensis]
MTSRFSLASWRLRHRLIALGAGSVVVTAGVLVGAGAWQSDRFTEQAGERVDELTESDLSHVTDGVDRLATAVGESVLQAQDRSMGVARAVVAGSGGVGLDREATATWRATDQVSGEVSTVSLPRVEVDGAWLGQNTDVDTRTPLVDEIRRMVGGPVTVFQRMNARGDLLRVATNVENAEGKRAIGTYIPAVNADGSANAVASAIAAGDSYRGVAKVVDTWNVAAYDPLRDASGRVIGAVFVGVPQAEAIAALSGALSDMTVGEHGSVSILSTAAADRGRVIASTDDALVGGELVAEDADGVPWVEQVLAGAVELDEGELASASYRLGGAGAAPAESTVYSAYYPAYQWAIVVQAYGPDYAAAAEALAEGRSTMMRMFVLVGLGLAVVGAAVAWLVATRMSRRMARLTSAMTSLAERDLTVEVPEDGTDEIGTMSRALNRAVGQLHGLLTDITAEAGRVDAAAHRLGGVGADLTSSADEATRLSGAASAGQVSDNVATLSVGSEEMTASIGEISGSAQEAAAVARESVALAGDVERVMKTLSESSSRIADVVDVITSIAEQTNLLALNATIEAARAGEAGKGFAVVAGEVKELATQTAQATDEVTSRVATIKNDTASATAAIEAITETIGRVDGYQTAIAAAVEEQTATTNDMSRNVASAAAGSGLIFDSLGEVETTMGRTREAVAESRQATEDLGHTVARLGELVGAFRV